MHFVPGKCLRKMQGAGQLEGVGVSHIPYHTFRSCMKQFTGPTPSLEGSPGVSEIYNLDLASGPLPQSRRCWPHSPLMFSGKEAAPHPFPLVSPPGWPNPSFLPKYSQSSAQTSEARKSYDHHASATLLYSLLISTLKFVFICFESVLLFTWFL